MSTDHEDLMKMLARDEFPLSSKYDPEWILKNQMGLHPLWLTEWLCSRMDIRSDMRILDLACGKALSSIFLAKEFGAPVWAHDLWISADENWNRIVEADVDDRVFPVQGDARSLPYARKFFDAVICVDAFIYFGTDDLYLNYLTGFLRPGGRIGIVVPGFMQELDGPLPDHLRPFWGQDCWSWHTVDWWRKHWLRTDLVNIELADSLTDGAGLWLQWKRARQVVEGPQESLKTDIEVLETDRGRYMGFHRLIARRKGDL